MDIEIENLIKRKDQKSTNKNGHYSMRWTLGLLTSRNFGLNYDGLQLSSFYLNRLMVRSRNIISSLSQGQGILFSLS